MQKVSLSLSLSLSAVSVVVGFVAGQVIRGNHGEAEAASANITVSNNDQIITVDRATSSQTITRTSTVTVKDPESIAGYSLSARIVNNPIPGSTVTVGSSSSTQSCTVAVPCVLGGVGRVIHVAYNTQAPTDYEYTTIWTVQITIPSNTSLGNYPVDIGYEEVATAIDPMQSFTVAQCNALSDGRVKWLRDTRDSKIYRVKKMVDDRCWMVDDLAFDLSNANAPAFSPAAALISAPTPMAVDRARYVVAPSHTTAAGDAVYYYNFCAAVGNISLNCSASNGSDIYDTIVNGVLDTTGTAVSQPAVTGVCPAPFRLPKGGPEATNRDPDTTANEFAKLDIEMGGTGANRADANTYDLFQGTGDDNKNWFGVLTSGMYTGDGFNWGGVSAGWISSTISGVYGLYNLGISNFSGSRHISTANGAGYGNGMAVRCIL